MSQKIHHWKNIFHQFREDKEYDFNINIIEHYTNLGDHATDITKIIEFGMNDYLYSFFKNEYSNIIKLALKFHFKSIIQKHNAENADDQISLNEYDILIENLANDIKNSKGFKNFTAVNENGHCILKHVISRNTKKSVWKHKMKVAVSDYVETELTKLFPDIKTKKDFTEDDISLINTFLNVQFLNPVCDDRFQKLLRYDHYNKHLHKDHALEMHLDNEHDIEYHVPADLSAGIIQHYSYEKNANKDFYHELLNFDNSVIKTENVFNNEKNICPEFESVLISRLNDLTTKQCVFNELTYASGIYRLLNYVYEQSYKICYVVIKNNLARFFDTIEENEMLNNEELKLNRDFIINNKEAFKDMTHIEKMFAENVMFARMLVVFSLMTENENLLKILILSNRYLKNIKDLDCCNIKACNILLEKVFELHVNDNTCCNLDIENTAILDEHEEAVLLDIDDSVSKEYFSMPHFANNDFKTYFEVKHVQKVLRFDYEFELPAIGLSSVQHEYDMYYNTMIDQTDLDGITDMTPFGDIVKQEHYVLVKSHLKDLVDRIICAFGHHMIRKCELKPMSAKCIAAYEKAFIKHFVTYYRETFDNCPCLSAAAELEKLPENECAGCCTREDDAYDDYICKCVIRNKTYILNLQEQIKKIIRKHVKSSVAKIIRRHPEISNYCQICNRRFITDEEIEQEVNAVLEWILTKQLHAFFKTLRSNYRDLFLDDCCSDHDKQLRTQFCTSQKIESILHLNDISEYVEIPEIKFPIYPSEQSNEEDDEADVQ